MNDQQIAALVGLCSQWWPNWRAPEAMGLMVKSWRPLLGDVDFDAGLAALSEYATAGNLWPPPLGVLRREAAKLVMPGGQAPTVDEAWGNVQAEISRVGMQAGTPGGRELAFIHPAVQAVVNALGWDELCTSTNGVADRAHFGQMYREQVDRSVSRAAEAPNVRNTREVLAARAAHPEGISVGDSVGELLGGTR